MTAPIVVRRRFATTTTWSRSRNCRRPDRCGSGPRPAAAHRLGVVAAPTDVLTTRLEGFGTTIFAEMSALAVETGSINLGQGFPDTDGPREVLDAAISSINGGLNQYPPLPGMAVLREAVAATHTSPTGQ